MPEEIPGESVPINPPAEGGAPVPTPPASEAPAGEAAAAPEPSVTPPTPSSEAFPKKKTPAERVAEARETFIGNVIGLLTKAEGLTAEHNSGLLEIHAAMKDTLPIKVIAAVKHLRLASGLLGEFVLDLEAVRPQAQEAKDKAKGALSIAAEVIGEESRGGREIVSGLAHLAGNSGVFRIIGRPRSRARRAVRKIEQTVTNIENTILAILPQEELGVRPTDASGEPTETSSIADPLVENYSLGNSIIAGIQRYKNRF